MELEILLTILGKISNACTAGAILSLITLVFSVIVYGIAATAGCGKNEKECHCGCGRANKIGKFLFKCAIAPLIIFGLLSAVPTIDDIWKTRIALIKFRLASPENVNKGVDEIARIARKLECKYIGCEKTVVEEK